MCRCNFIILFLYFFLSIAIPSQVTSCYTSLWKILPRVICTRFLKKGVSSLVSNIKHTFPSKLLYSTSVSSFAYNNYALSLFINNDEEPLFDKILWH